MATQAPSPGWRTWLEKQAQPQGDGTYLARPWGYFSRVYQIDERSKRHWVTFRIASLWLAAAAVAAVALIKGDDPWDAPRVIVSGLLAFGALLLVGYGGTYLIFRHAPSVARERWEGPHVVDPYGRYPLNRWRGRMIGWGAFTLLFSGWAIFSNTPGRLRQSLPLIVVFAALFLLTVFNYWRARQRPAEPLVLWQDPTTRPPRHRTLLAILIAPSGTTLLVLVGAWLARLSVADGGPHRPHDYSSLLWLAAISYALSYTAGIPVFLLARRLGWRTWRAHLAAGFLIGVVAVLLLGMVDLIFPAATSAHLSPAQLLGAAAGIGILTQPIGLLYWLVARPDRSV
ncbi:MAG TPA: hypothetical protein VF113_13385 [Stellaceae bacterium]